MTFKPAVSRGLCQVFPDRIHSKAGMTLPAMRGSGAHAYLVDGGYGLADAALTPFVSRLHELAMDWMWDDRPHVAAWWDTVRDRDSFGTVFDAFPDPRRKAGLRAAGEETREAAERILSGSPCR